MPEAFSIIGAALKAYERVRLMFLSREKKELEALAREVLALMKRSLGPSGSPHSHAFSPQAIASAMSTNIEREKLTSARPPALTEDRIIQALELLASRGHVYHDQWGWYAAPRQEQGGGRFGSRWS